MNVDERQKREWAQLHAQRLNLLFEKWQQPLGIESDAYCDQLLEELLEACDDPLRKSLIETLA